MNITNDEYSAFQHFLRQSCGIEIGENKQYLVKNRLMGVLKAFNLASFSELLADLNKGSGHSSRLHSSVVDAMTTNETFWFRDDTQFAALQDEVLADIFLKKNGAIKIWSAACSSGQEPYSISMCIEELAKTKGVKHPIHIVGTDISATILNEARTALYSDMAMSRGLGASMHAHYFQKVSEGHRLRPEIINRVRFQQLNLLQPFVGLGKFDVIFCRNVLIYFSEQVKRDILRRLVEVLEPGGYLFLSSTESIPMDMNIVEPVRGKRARYFQKIS